MIAKYLDIAGRLREYAELNYLSISAFASALSMTPQTLHNYLSGKARPGGIMQQRLRDCGADVDWIMTGLTGRQRDLDIKKRDDEKCIRFHSHIPPSKELKERAERIVQMMIDNPGANGILLERVVKDILQQIK